MLLLCLTNLFCAPGGIPAFNRLLVRAAAEYAFERSEGLRVVVLNDDVGVKSEGTLQDLYPAAYLPCGGDRRRLLREVLRELPRRTVRSRGFGSCCAHPRSDGSRFPPRLSP